MGGLVLRIGGVWSNSGGQLGRFKLGGVNCTGCRGNWRLESQNCSSGDNLRRTSVRPVSRRPLGVWSHVRAGNELQREGQLGSQHPGFVGRVLGHANPLQLIPQTPQTLHTSFDQRSPISKLARDPVNAIPSFWRDPTSGPLASLRAVRLLATRGARSARRPRRAPTNRRAPTTRRAPRGRAASPSRSPNPMRSRRRNNTHAQRSLAPRSPCARARIGSGPESTQKRCQSGPSDPGWTPNRPRIDPARPQSGPKETPKRAQIRSLSGVESTRDALVRKERQLRTSGIPLRRIKQILCRQTCVVATRARFGPDSKENADVRRCYGLNIANYDWPMLAEFWPKSAKFASKWLDLGKIRPTLTNVDQHLAPSRPFGQQMQNVGQLAPTSANKMAQIGQCSSNLGRMWVPGAAFDNPWATHSSNNASPARHVNHRKSGGDHLSRQDGVVVAVWVCRDV